MLETTRQIQLHVDFRVGGCTNPAEKYASRIEDMSLGRDEHKKILETTS